MNRQQQEIKLGTSQDIGANSATFSIDVIRKTRESLISFWMNEEGQIKLDGHFIDTEYVKQLVKYLEKGLELQEKFESLIPNGNLNTNTSNEQEESNCFYCKYNLRPNKETCTDCGVCEYETHIDERGLCEDCANACGECRL